jgi:hypothetical protein
VDFVTEAAVRKRLVTFLESLGYETLYFVDFIYVDGVTADRLFEGAETSFRLGGHELSVPRAEHLAAMKVHAMKNDSGRALQEMADIRFLLQLDGVDEDEIREYFENADLEGKFDEIKRSILTSTFAFLASARVAPQTNCVGGLGREPICRS